MKISIKCRFTNKILFEGEFETTKAAVIKAVESRAKLYGADLSGANLYGADLSGADLSGANLYGANLYGADLSGELLKITPIQLNGLRWDILITHGFLKIGCQRHSHKTWAEFKRTDIAPMADNAWDWWKQHKDALLTLCAINASEAAKLPDVTPTEKA